MELKIKKKKKLKGVENDARQLVHVVDVSV
jgi:hypothetical protein